MQKIHQQSNHLSSPSMEEISPLNQSITFKTPLLESYQKKLKSVQQVVKEQLESEIRQFKKYSDRNRTIPPDFQPGQKVWLATKNINNTRPTKKLPEVWLGPFEVLREVGIHAYHLNFPLQWKSVHVLFHVQLLEPVKKSSIPNQNKFSPPQVLVEEKEEWEVAQFLDSKLKRGKL
ncbi:hypothetical protein O181_063708 [Austropuccinia psidii MF-1]|uniref:Tf2-1-like SH3-like domain-containing protein n=1 Tax=Austropuccinia psidii MF-1 TaxID=1389203 RepID=A0A9Q3ES56_9BASI|nr:hypothetical protein [Austropuccinia psidii MF-1]